MNKTWAIIAVIIVVLVVVLVAVFTSSPADPDDISKISELLNDPKTAAKNCAATCKSLTKRYNIFARGKPKRLCMSDCSSGKDVTKIKY